MTFLNIKTNFHSKQHKKNHYRNLRKRYKRFKKTTTKIYVQDERKLKPENLTLGQRDLVEFEFGLLETFDVMRTKIKQQMEIVEDTMFMFDQNELPKQGLVGHLRDWANNTCVNISIVN